MSVNLKWLASVRFLYARGYPFRAITSARPEPEAYPLWGAGRSEVRKKASASESRLPSIFWVSYFAIRSLMKYGPPKCTMKASHSKAQKA